MYGSKNFNFKKSNVVASDNAIQVEELKLRKMKLSRIQDMDQFFDGCLELLNDTSYDFISFLEFL